MVTDSEKTTRVRGRGTTVCCRSLLLAVAAILLVGISATPALAETSPEAKKRAMAALEIAKQYYAEKEFRLAAKLFHKAYSLDPKPAFLYNAARAEQRGFMLEEAQRDYERLIGLKNADAETRKRAKIKLEEVREAREHYKPAPKIEKADKPAPVKAEAEAEAVQPAAKAETTATVEPEKQVTKKEVQVHVVNFAEPSPSRWLGWLSLGLGSASLAVGSMIALQSHTQASELREEVNVATVAGQEKLSTPDYDSKQEEVDDSKQEEVDGHNSKTITGLVLAGIGVVVAGVGAYLLFESPEEPEVALDVGASNRPRATLTWRF